MKYLFHIVLFLAALAACTRPVDVLLITGGHAYDTTEFFELFHSLEGVFTDSVSHPLAMDRLASESISDYDLLVFYDFVPDMPLKDSVVFQELTRMGMPMLFLHHSLCTFQSWKGYEAMLGGTYIMPEFCADSSLHAGYEHDLDLRIEVLDPVHPVTEGIDTFHIHDEGYYNIRIHDQVHPLFGTHHPKCSPLMGWVNTSEQSTIIYLMFGHDRHAYANESFKLVLSNSIQWLTRQ